MSLITRHFGFAGCVIKAEGRPGRAASTAFRAKTNRAIKQRCPQQLRVERIEACEFRARCREIARLSSNKNRKQYMEAMPNCQVAKVRHMHSLWMFGFKFHGFSSVTTGANVEMRKSMSANSRNPADLHIIQQPFVFGANARPPKRHKGGWIDLKLTMETMFVGFRSCKTGASSTVCLWCK